LTSPHYKEIKIVIKCFNCGKELGQWEIYYGRIGLSLINPYCKECHEKLKADGKIKAVAT